MQAVHVQTDFSSIRGRRVGAVLTILVMLVLGGCDAGAGVGVLGPGSAASHTLPSGLYRYRAWSDASYREIWWGYFDLRVQADGRMSGTYRLPRQCTDSWGWEADCIGHIGGRIHSDGTLRFGLDEGWLSHEGAVNRRSEATGRWWTRILGYTDRGTFELLRY